MSIVEDLAFLDELDERVTLLGLRGQLGHVLLELDARVVELDFELGALALVAILLDVLAAHVQQACGLHARLVGAEFALQRLERAHRLAQSLRLKLGDDLLDFGHLVEVACRRRRRRRIVAGRVVYCRVGGRRRRLSLDRLVDHRVHE